MREVTVGWRHPLMTCLGSRLLTTSTMKEEPHITCTTTMPLRSPEVPHSLATHTTMLTHLTREAPSTIPTHQLGTVAPPHPREEQHPTAMVDMVAIKAVPPTIITPAVHLTNNPAPTPREVMHTLAPTNPTLITNITAATTNTHPLEVTSPTLTTPTSSNQTRHHSSTTTVVVVPLPPLVPVDHVRALTPSMPGTTTTTTRGPRLSRDLPKRAEGTVATPTIPSTHPRCTTTNISTATQAAAAHHPSQQTSANVSHPHKEVAEMEELRETAEATTTKTAGMDTEVAVVVEAQCTAIISSTTNPTLLHSTLVEAEGDTPPINIIRPTITTVAAILLT